VTDRWNDLLTCLDLGEPVAAESDTGSIGSVSFEGQNLQLGYHRLFGGQLLAQFIQAASLATPGKTVKSMHALFPRAGATDEPVRYEVERPHTGGTFATRTIVARQAQGVVATATVSMHASEGGPEHQTADPVPAVPGAEHQVDLGMLPWATRSEADLDTPKSEAPEFELWMRTPPVNPDLATALIAYATDLTLIGTALRPIEGVSQQDAGTAFTSAVTSHSVWFHRPFRTDDWLLLRQHSPILAHGRCFGRGDVLTTDGAVVASFAQEALLRFRE
jgi:acyl-CoA thioesterase